MPRAQTPGYLGSQNHAKTISTDNFFSIFCLCSESIKIAFTFYLRRFQNINHCLLTSMIQSHWGSKTTVDPRAGWYDVIYCYHGIKRDIVYIAAYNYIELWTVQSDEMHE